MAGILRPRTIGGQLSRILAFALILVLALLTVTAFGAYAEYRESDDTTRAVSLALRVQDLTDQIQRELGLSNGLLGGDERLQQPLAEQRRSVDRTLDAVKGVANSDAPGADQVRAALGQLNLLGNTRTQIDTRRISRPVVIQFYNDAVGTLNQLTLGLDQANDPEIQRGLQAFYALGAAKEQFDKERGFLNGVFVVGHFSGGEYGQFMEIRATKQAALQSFSRYATKSRQADLDEAMLGDNAAEAEQAEAVALASGDGPLVRPVDPMNWWNRMTGVIDAQRAVQKKVGNDVQARADDLRAAATTKLIIFLVGAAIAVIAMIALVLASVRALVRPLAELAGEADDVASRRLPRVIDEWAHAVDSRPEAPAPVRMPKGSSTEIAAVAGALDRVQATAFELASQQALVRRNTTESMANLARRNQNLVRRQLGLISEFERKELDPQGLANLFELDHLATRMRRNAESLLVLVGENSPRRLARPVALTNVIRAGMSEVDDYRRVVLRRVDDVMIVGGVASELSHMLAELIENGLAFSPPDLEVEIYGRRAAHGYLLAVVDHGVGMPPDQLAQSNAKLRGEQDFIVAPSRYLGHYVVGRLAKRLGIDVELNTSPVSGIVARMTLPSELLAAEQDHQPATVEAKAPVTVIEPAWGADSVTHRMVEAEARPEITAPTARGEASPPVRMTGPEPSAPRSAAPEPVTGSWNAPRPAADPGAATTRNGLIRRNKRSRGAESTSGPQLPRPETAAPPPERGPATQRSPQETASMLASFRAGHERGTGHERGFGHDHGPDDARSTPTILTAEENW
ncbi:nitrate- and nitrite sensing domain-containing protein [Nocardia sp. CDC159]|uniref:histidine kinase n=1 Tax=Nocardia pulmonis TaxID=2951408 RepID=A0A9X2J0U9_9NOCA|nr:MULTISPECIES: nitrate- and nitrite sensing domain-containing protein [Nocardia]MCM6778209.1 nitrate- and nitrite sensing domain-containing protein [Nocardia pulmonis]MCM6791098.1 nitrate- and nitrite sensing domain-containing protein [Nocardia sp. CDC159]